MMIDEIRAFLALSGLASHLHTFDAELPRWECRLRSLGLTSIGRLGAPDLTPAQVQAQNHLNLLILQEAVKRNVGAAAPAPLEARLRDPLTPGQRVRISGYSCHTACHNGLETAARTSTDWTNSPRAAPTFEPSRGLVHTS